MKKTKLNISFKDIFKYQVFLKKNQKLENIYVFY